MATLQSQTDPAHNIVAVTASDTVADPGGPFRGLLIDGTAGAVKLTTSGGTAVTLSNLSVGVVYPFYFTRVWSTGTLATNIYGLT